MIEQEHFHYFTTGRILPFPLTANVNFSLRYTHRDTRGHFLDVVGFLTDEDPCRVSELEGLLGCLESKPFNKCRKKKSTWRLAKYSATCSNRPPSNKNENKMNTKSTQFHAEARGKK